MASKKFKLLLMGIFSLLSLGVFAQDTGVYNIFDSSVIPSKGKAQQNEFMNNTYDFPAKPRDQWEIGISGGLFSIQGDVPAKLPTAGFGLHVRKSLGYVFSLRLQYVYGMAKGLDWKPSLGYSNNSAWNTNYAVPSPVYYNYKSTVQDIGIQGLFSMNNIRFHKNQTSMVLYGGAGIGATFYDTKVNALNGSTPYNFSSISGSGYSDRKDIRKALKDMMDDSYETDAQDNNDNSSKLKPSASLIGGIAFKLGKRVNLAIEDKFSIVKYDLLDGQEWQERPVGDPVLTGNFDSYNYLSVGLNFNIGSSTKSIQPLWWINPLDYAYSEINNPKHMKIPPPVLPDGDGDGITDQFDREPNTPAGCPVDTHGVSKDTDGDGVPDCKDKELITPTQCQPVDADGVGKCPEPDCCRSIRDSLAAANVCNIGDLPSISFKNRTSSVSNDAQAMLATVASKLKNNAACSITVTGYPAASKASQALCNKRIDAIKAYLTEKEGISAVRITTTCEVGGGDVNTVDIRSN
jgi:hypothetical protein